MGIPEKVVIPLAHIGAPSHLSRVIPLIGQVIEDTESYVSPGSLQRIRNSDLVDTRIISFNRPITCIEIKPDGLQEVKEDIKPLSVMG